MTIRSVSDNGGQQAVVRLLVTRGCQADLPDPTHGHKPSFVAFMLPTFPYFGGISPEPRLSPSCLFLPLTRLQIYALIHWFGVIQ